MKANSTCPGTAENLKGTDLQVSRQYIMLYMDVILSWTSVNEFQVVPSQIYVLCSVQIQP